MRRAALLALLLASAPEGARAALTPAELARVGVRTPAGAALPMRLPFRDEAGRPVTPAKVAEGRPLVLVFADYGCATLCGPALAITGDRLRETGLAAGRDWRLAVVGLEPGAPPERARALADARLPAPVRAAATPLTGDADAVRRAAAAVGYGYVWDAEARTFAHPVAAFVLAPDGRVVRTLSEVALTAPELSAAIADARAGRAPAGFADLVAITCHRVLAAATGQDAAVLGGLRAGGVATLALMAGALTWLVRRRRAAA